MAKGFFKVHALLYEVRRIENRILAEHWDAFKKRRKLDDRIDLLAEGLGKIALLARSLAELLLKKGFMTPKELEAQFFQTDLADGVRDQRLDPRVSLPGEGKLPDPKRKPPRRKPRRRGSVYRSRRGKRP